MSYRTDKKIYTRHWVIVQRGLHILTENKYLFCGIIYYTLSLFFIKVLYYLQNFRDDLANTACQK